MTTINIKFLSNKNYCFSGWVGAMRKGAIIQKRSRELNELIVNINSIDEVLSICKIHYKNSIENNLLIYITINSNEYILNNNFNIVTQNEIDKLEFVPFIKYDIENIRTATIKPFKEKLYYCKNIVEQTKLINDYIKKPYRRFKKWETKPNKIFLHHSYNEEPIEFKIKYDKYIS